MPEYFVNRIILDIIRNESQSPRIGDVIPGVPVDIVFKNATEFGLTSDKTKDVLSELKSKHKITEPKPGYVTLT